MTAGWTPQGELPTTLNWYREAANWLVGLAAGAIAGSIALLGTVEVAQLGLRWLFAIGLAGLAVAVAFGILFHLWLLKYANLLEVERRVRTASWPLLPASPLDQKRQAGLITARASYAFFHNALLFSFTLGLLAPASAGIILLSGNEQAPTDVPTYTVVSIEEGSRGVNAPKAIALLVEIHTGQTWAIRLDSNGNLSKLALGSPPKDGTQHKIRQ